MEHTSLELYIQIRDGQPHEHPIFGDNFREAFPDVDVNNLPADRFAKFIRVEKPQIGTYQVYEGVTYEWFDGIVKDVHHVREMTEAEAAEKTAQLEAEALRIHQLRMDALKEALETETDETGILLISNCLTAHEEWSLHGVDPITPPFPLFPVQDKDGNWKEQTSN